jgi:hypothetical protein
MQNRASIGTRLLACFWTTLAATSTPAGSAHADLFRTYQAQEVQSRIGVQTGEAQHVKQVEELITSAESLPIEFRADIQLTAIESGTLPNSKATEKTLERLFDSAGSVQVQYKQKPVDPTANTLARENFGVQTLNLDSLSIRIRIIKAMLSMDRIKAQRELEETRFQIPAAGCRSPLIPDVSEYYAQLPSLASRVFPSDERGRGAQSFWVKDNIQSLSSAVQLAPMAELLAEMEFGVGRFGDLLAAYMSVLQRLQATDREMAAIENEHTLSRAMRLLLTRTLNETSSAALLLSAYRTFLLRSAAAVPCGDVTANWNHVVQAFDQLRRDYDPDGAVGTIDLSGFVRPSGKGDHAEVEYLPDSSTFDGLLSKVYALKQRETAWDGSNKQPDTQGWETDLAAFLKQIDAYDPSKAECEDCAYYDKAKLLLLFFDLAPAGSYKDKILERLVSVLARDPMQVNAPLLWAFQVKLLLNMSRKTSKEQVSQIERLQSKGQVLTMLPSAAGPKILASMKQSNNYVLYFYAVADELLQNQFVSPPYLQ